MTTPIPEYPVFGTDVSKWQKTVNPIDFAKMKAAGADFVIMRVGFGTEPDVDINYNATASADHFRVRGGYWFPDHRYLTTQYQQLQAMRAAFSTYNFEMPHVIDIEALSKNKVATFPERGTALDFYKPFVEDIKQKTGRPAMIYLNKGVIDMLSPLPPWLLECPLWIASWKRATPWFAQWPTWKVWQTGVYSRGPEFGCDSPTIDLNVFNGTLEDLLDFANPKPEPEPVIVPIDYNARLTEIERKLESARVGMEVLRREHEDLLSVLRESYKDTGQALQDL